MYPAAGTFSVPGYQGIVIHDVTAAGGVEWSTWDLTWIDDDTPWVAYKGLWGPNIQLYNSYVRGLPTMKNGPSGPAFKPPGSRAGSTIRSCFTQSPAIPTPRMSSRSKIRHWITAPFRTANIDCAT